MPDYLKLSIDFQAPVYKRHAAAAMNWLCYFVILLAVFLAVDRSKAAVLLEQRQKPLLFVHQASCTYDYEVAVHTARGAQSTAGEGFQLHALVSSQLSNRVELNYFFKDQRIFFYFKAAAGIFLRKNILILILQLYQYSALELIDIIAWHVILPAHWRKSKPWRVAQFLFQSIVITLLLNYNDHIVLWHFR